MADEPPIALTELLSKLHLATPEQVRGVRGRARRLARDLPLFDSVWIDALAQARLLTPFQAAEINAGRGEQLLVGPYVLRRLVQRVGNTDCFLACAIESEEKRRNKKRQLVHVMVVRGVKPFAGEQAAAELRADAERFSAVKPNGVVLLQAAGFYDGALWAAYDRPLGFPANEWLSCQGRFSPPAALEIARQMVASLAALEKANVVHGDIAASSSWLTDSGNVQLTRCGMRRAIKLDPLARGAISFEMLDYIAPEILEPSEEMGAPSITCDMYACGMVWWHLLAGRLPLVGGNQETKLQAARDGKIPDIRRIAPDVTKILADAIGHCTQRDPGLRPQSFAELEAVLGPPSAAGRRLLALELFRGGRQTNRGDFSRKIQSALQGAGQPLLAATICALLLAAATWPLWRARHPAAEVRNKVFVAIENGRRRLPNAENGLAIFQPRDCTKYLQPAHHDRADRNVRPASFQTRDESAEGDKNPLASVPDRPIVELNVATETAGNTLRLQTGTIVRGKEGKRPRIVMPPNGLAITVDNVRFENVDFVWRQRAEEITSPDRHALLELRANQTEFEGCTFQAKAAGSFELPVAIRLGTNLQRGAALAPAVRVRLDCCVIEGVACGVDCVAKGPIAIRASNTLYTGKGPLVRFPQARRSDASAEVTLQHVTVRSATAAMELNGDDEADSSGTVIVNTTGCVFAPEQSGALVIFSGRRLPKVTGGVLAALDWSCQDSLVSPGTTVAIWRHDETRETLPDEELPLEGLVASPFDFASSGTSESADSRLKRWLAPMRTELTPGIGDDLPQPPDIETTPPSGDKQ